MSAIKTKKSPAREDAARFRKIREQMPTREEALQILEKDHEKSVTRKDRKSAKSPEVES